MPKIQQFQLADDAKPYDIAGGTLGKPDANAEIASFVAIRSFTFPTNMAGSQGKAKVAATSASAFSIQKNGTTFAWMTFNGTTATFSGPAATTTIAVGDVITVQAPATIDSTLSGLRFTLVGTLV